MRKRVVAHGRVQGVFFRDTTRRLAEELDVSGSARNTPDGTVEAVFEGEPHAVERLVAFMRAGPPGACVEHVEVYDEPEEGIRGFTIA